MIRPVRLAIGAALAFFGAVACSDASRVTSPEDLSARDALTTPAAEPGPITSRLSGNVCVDVSQASNNPGTSLVVARCGGAAGQQFTWTPAGEVRVFGDKCMDVSGASATDGARVAIWDCNGGDNQKWKLTAANEIRGMGDKCLTVENGRTAGGTPLTLRSCNGSTAQKWKVRTVATAPAASGTPTGQASIGKAELPHQYLATAMSATPSKGRVIRVAAGGDLQAALDQAQLGDQVVLDAGATFVGNYTLPAKTAGSGWITVRSSGALPGEGVRMTPARAQAAGLPKILTGITAPVIQAAPGAHHYRFVGVEVGATSAVTFGYSLVSLGTVEKSQNSVAAAPHHLILDRVYVHGHGNLDFARCVGLHGAALAVVDSYVSECHGRGRDSQAVWGANGPGPFKIVNNYLEAAGEVVMFGGDDSRAAELLPHDIEIRHNHITRPTAWKGVWLVKNLLELKEGVRVLIQGNILENHWADAQDGFAVVLKTVDQYGSAPWTTTQDVTFRSNILRNVGGGFNMHPKPEPTPSIPAARFTLANNLAYNVNVGPYTGHGRMYQVLQNMAGTTIAHNTTLISDGSAAMLSLGETPAASDFRFENNVATHGQYGMYGSGAGEGTSALARYIGSDGVVAGNALIAFSAGQYPANNQFPASVAAAGFQNAAGNDYRLGAGSPLKGKGTDGRDPGVDFAELESMTAGVIQ